VVSNPVRISAHADHSAHAKNRTIATYREAVATNADYVEFDIRKTADGELVAFHDPATGQGHRLSAVGYAQLCDLAGYEVPKVADVLAVIKGRSKGHLDLKETGYEHQLVQLALETLGPGEFIVTSLEDASVAAIRSRFRDVDEVPVAGAPDERRAAPGAATGAGQRAVARVPAAGLRRGLGRHRPAARPYRGSRAVPSPALEGHGLDR
jgi:glycerophosphoryl diester phosphodiesterase